MSMVTRCCVVAAQRLPPRQHSVFGPCFRCVRRNKAGIEVRESVVLFRGKPEAIPTYTEAKGEPRRCPIRSESEAA